MAYEARNIGEKSLQALTKQGLLKGSRTYKLEFCEHCVIGKKIKVLSSDNEGEYTSDPFL